MKHHTRVYMSKMGYTDTDYMGSELSDLPGVDIHHIISRGKGGEDRIENLMLLTREEHIMYGDKVDFMVFLLESHRKKLDAFGIDYDKEWFNLKIRKYE